MKVEAPSSIGSFARLLAILSSYFALAKLGTVLWPSGWVMVPVIGCSFILSGCLNAAHDCVHSTHYGSRWLNRIFGIAWCTVILFNFTIYRRQHIIHHRFPGVEGDTESPSRIVTVLDYLLVQSSLAFWKAIFKRMVLTWRHEFPNSISSKQLERAAQIDNLTIHLWLTLCIWCTYNWPEIMIPGYWLPLFFYPIFVLFFSLPEHFALNQKNIDWPRARNVSSNMVVRFFQWNANYHALHHRRPRVPALGLYKAWRSEGNGHDPWESSYLRFHFQLIENLYQNQKLPFNPHNQKKGNEHD